MSILTCKQAVFDQMTLTFLAVFCSPLLLMTDRQHELNIAEDVLDYPNAWIDRR